MRRSYEEERAFRVRIKRPGQWRWRTTTFYDYEGWSAEQIADSLADAYPVGTQIEVAEEAT